MVSFRLAQGLRGCGDSRRHTGGSGLLPTLDKGPEENFVSELIADRYQRERWAM